MGLSLITPPAAEPVTLAEAKVHCRVDADITADDALLTALIVAARQAAEHETGRALVTQSWRLTLPGFPQVIQLPRPRLQSVASVKYFDVDGVEQTLDAAAYRVVTDELVGLVVPVSFFSPWPATDTGPAAVSIDYVAGYGAAAVVPQAIKQWMLLCIGGWYAARESLTPGALVSAPRSFHDALLDPYRILRVV